ncbi:SH3-like domain-containing protein [Yoonia sediminilitoris]|uniref:Nitrile hydratase n=1 Tax=Yoonia sediminilitoris TaxID=1286148 RepID=A0A2T6KDR2_9RHOB|nr:SH3-like domain-containing protein [Yoonia sediminilitoris]PUB13176.1 nitrile hydratase [Yoonia sediminilitoris]RCW94511.1 nitrile hydratase [Yoonia sediminilitoris]
MAERRYVRVRGDMPPGHVRTPAYLRGKTGWVERTLGPFPNPEQLAYGVPPAKLPLMRVRFLMSEVWGPAAENPQDTIDAEIYSHWLEEAPHAT